MPISEQEKAADGPVELGHKLRYFRRANGHTQEVVGEWLGLSARLISYIEHGRRPLDASELAILKEHEFNPDAIELPSTPILPTTIPRGTGANPVFGAVQYFQAQDQFLDENHKPSESPYALWFLNSSCLPVLDSDEVLETWVDSLRDGIDYNTFWVLEDTDELDLARFLERIKVIGDNLGPPESTGSGREPAEKRKKQERGKVNVYPILWGAEGNLNDAALTIDDYESRREEYQTRREEKAEAGGPVVLHPVLDLRTLPNPAMRDKIRREIDRSCAFYFSVVVYAPKTRLNSSARGMTVELDSTAKGLPQPTTADGSSPPPKKERWYVPIDGEPRNRVVKLFYQLERLATQSDSLRRTS